jgi:hypothetical protein
MAHEKTIAWIERRHGIERPWRTVEEAQHRLATTIDDIEQETTVSACRIEGLEHGEVGGKAHLACGVTRCEVEIRNHAVAGVRWIDHEMHHAFKKLVRTGIPKGLAFHERATMRNVECDNGHRRLSFVCDVSTAGLVMRVQALGIDQRKRNIPREARPTDSDHTGV